MNEKSVRVDCHGGGEIVKRTGYMIDLYRMSYELRARTDMVYEEKIYKIVEDHTAIRHLALVCGKAPYNKNGPRWIPGL